MSTEVFEGVPLSRGADVAARLLSLFLRVEMFGGKVVNFTDFLEGLFEVEKI